TMNYRDALYYAMTGDTFDGKKAKDIGFVNFSYPKAKLKEETVKLARKLMEKSPAVLRYTKEGIRAVRFMNEPQAADYLNAKSDALKLNDKENSRQEGMRQFLDEKTYRPGLGNFKRKKAAAKSGPATRSLCASIMDARPLTPSPRREEGRDERLSCVSSVLPWPVVSENSVEDGQKLSGDGDECDHLGLASCHETIEEDFQGWVVLLGDHRAHEHGRAGHCSATADEAASPPLARLAREWGEAGEGCNFLAAELPELGQLGHQGAGDDLSDARHGGEQVLLLSPGWRAPYGVVDIYIDTGQFLLQRLEKPCDALLEAWRRHSSLALAFGHH